ncbi:MAG TPA: hypothetical protein VGO52_04230 [Hyphomonadaceae bacterium]|jgi:hypothetical protein|nr:hypothetical protein [Hyphomonadaceae bacterium]
MAEVIELSVGEEPSKFERYAMVLVSDRPSVAGALLSANHGKRIFYAYDNPADFAAAIERAKMWADENLIRRVYVRRAQG